MARVEAVCLSNRGLVRAHNEDNFMFCGEMRMNDPAGKPIELYIHNLERAHCVVGVFDGMGGSMHGERASYTAASCFLADPISAQPFDNYLLANCELANQTIQKNNLERGEDSGTTAALIGFAFRTAILCNVGDSRIYRFSHDHLEQLSKDHTDEALLQSMGVMDRTPRLMQYLGMENNIRVVPEIKKVKFRVGDMFLCCTDGLYSMVEESQLAEILSRSLSIQGIARELMGTALSNGGRDNITFILCRIKSWI